MIHYKPPKSQIWGHQVGRLKATEIVERSLSFLDAHCQVINSNATELMIGWNEGSHAPVAEEVVRKVEDALGQPTRTHDLPGADGRLFHQRRWPFSITQLPMVATWFDSLAEAMQTQEVVAQSSTLWMFAWRDEPLPVSLLHSAGGMLGAHLSCPHRITTMFSFRERDQYEKVKAALSALELVELSDKHLRPQVEAGETKPLRKKR